MTHVSLYLVLAPVESVVPRLLEKIYETGEHCLFRVKSEQEAEDWNKVLWTYSQKSFLPHGSATDGYAAVQPIWITPAEENLNKSSIYLIIDAFCPPPSAGFAKGIEVVNVNSEAGIVIAQKRIKEYTEKGQKIKVWKQTPEGKWTPVDPSQAALSLC